MSNHKLVRMARAHEARRRSRMRRTWKLGSGLSKGIAATVALAAGAVGVLAYLGWNPFASTPPPAAGVVDRILAESDSYKAPAQLIAPLEAQMQNTCTSETVNGPQSAAMKCWLSLAGFYSGSAQFRLTISAIDRAQEINTRIADPYYLLGATYWDMIMFDLVKTGNYRIVNPQQLIVNLFPDADSVALAHLAAQQLQEAQGLPYIDINSPPKNVGTISQADIAETQDQISTINNGATVLQPGPNSMPIFLDILAAVYPHNKEVTSEFVIMGQSLFNEMKAHPDQFPGLPPGV
jgi:hypothetical protein